MAASGVATSWGLLKKGMPNAGAVVVIVSFLCFIFQVLSVKCRQYRVRANRRLRRHQLVVTLLSKERR